MKIVFFGTPSFAASVLEFLHTSGISIAALVTQPDRPQGRKLLLTPSATKQLLQLHSWNLPVLQPEKASEPQFLETLSELKADLFVVVAYGQILSKKLLAIPPLGCINVHASLLPKYRGAAPMQRALMEGATETGISIQKMVFQLDAGDVIDESRIPISSNCTLGELQEKLCDLAKPLLLSVIKRYETGIPAARPQNEADATFAPKIKPEEMQLQWNRDASDLHNQVRALSPRPGAWCWIEQAGERKRLKVLQSRNLSQDGLPGELLAFEKDQCLVAAARGALQLLMVQPEGKRPMGVAEWIRGCSSPPSFLL